MGDALRFLVELTAEESLRLLGSVSMGRVVFTMDAMPAIRPVNHIVDDGAVVICSHEGAAIVKVAGGNAEEVVVAYEADAFDPADRLGWSVIVTGVGSLVTDPDAIVRYRELIRPWVRGPMDYVVRIRPEMVTGFRLTPPEGGDDSASGPS